MQKIAESAQAAPVEELEATRPYISAPWEAQLDTTESVEGGAQAAIQAQETRGIRVATSALARNQLVSTGGAIKGIDWISNDTERHEYDKMVGTSVQSDAYTAALVSTEVGVGMIVNAVYAGALLPRAHGQTIHVFTNNPTQHHITHPRAHSRSPLHPLEIG
jgi:hypothetical protein